MRSIFDCAGQFQGMKELTFLYILFMIGPTLLSVPWFLYKFLRVGPIYKKEWKESPVQRIVAIARNVDDLRAATYSSMDRKVVTPCHRASAPASGPTADQWSCVLRLLRPRKLRMRSYIFLSLYIFSSPDPAFSCRVAIDPWSRSGLRK